MPLRLRCVSCSREWSAAAFAGAVQPRCECGGLLLPRADVRTGRERRTAVLPVPDERRAGEDRRSA